MPIPEAQARANNAAEMAAHANPVKARMTGFHLKFDDAKQEWVRDEQKKVEDRNKKIRWGWMGKNFGPDDKGFIREIVGSKDGKLIFGEGIPRHGFEYHQRNIRTNATHEFKFEVVDETPKEVKEEMEKK